MPQNSESTKYYGRKSIDIYIDAVYNKNMRTKDKKRKKTAQEIQDDIFRKMSVERKLEVSAQLWQLAKTLAGDKINYGAKRS